MVYVIGVLWCHWCAVVSLVCCGVSGVLWCHWCAVVSVVCCGVSGVLWCQWCAVFAVLQPGLCEGVRGRGRAEAVGKRTRRLQSQDEAGE